MIPAGLSDGPVLVSKADAIELVKAILSATERSSTPLRAAARVIRGWIGARDYLDGSTWHKMLLRLASGLWHGRARFPIFASKGNVKLPFVAFSALPIFTCPGAGACASHCYSFTAWRYPAALCRQIQNTLFLRHNTDAIHRFWMRLKTPKTKKDAPTFGPELTFRLYVDGDFDSVATVGFWMDLLRQRPRIHAYGYSKSWDVLQAYLRAGGEVPENYTLNLSPGGRNQTTAEEMAALPFVRGQFVAVDIRPFWKPGKGEKGFARYQSRAYHQAVRDAAAAAGLGKVFSCPGICGSCTASSGMHACGRGKDDFPITIANGIH
jgi:hypothetical protein